MSALQTLYSGKFTLSSLNLVKKIKVSNCALLVSLLHQIRFPPSCLAVNSHLMFQMLLQHLHYLVRVCSMITLTNYKYLTIVKIQDWKDLEKRRMH